MGIRMKTPRIFRGRHLNKTARYCKIGIVAMTLLVIFFFTARSVSCEPFFPHITVDIGDADTPQEVSSSIQVLILLTVLALAPSIIILMTAFTRIVKIGRAHV